VAPSVDTVANSRTRRASSMRASAELWSTTRVPTMVVAWAAGGAGSATGKAVKVNGQR
jgi:hypothetical protein